MPSISTLAASALVAISPAGVPEPPPSLDLTWEAPATCPDAGQVREWVQALSTRDGVAPVGARAHAVVREDNGGFSSTLTLEGPSPVPARELFADDCTTLARANAVVIAVALDPIAVAQAAAQAQVQPPPPVVTEPSTPPEPEPTIEASPAVAEPAPPVYAEPEPVERRPTGDVPGDRSASWRTGGPLRVGARIGTGVGGLVLPSAGVGFVLAPFVGGTRWRVQVPVQLWLRRSVELDATRDVRANLRMLTAGVRGGPVLGRGRVTFPLLAGVDVGGVFGEGTGADLSVGDQTSAPWAGVVLAPSLEASVLPWLSLWASAEGVISLYRPKFAIQGASDEWTAGAGGVRGLLGLQFHRP